MSYDLSLFAPRAINEADLHRLITQADELDVEEATARSTTVVRGARRRYSFTIDGPDRVEADDVPADVADAVLGSQYLYSVMVEGSAESEIPYAVRFARRLAQALDGAVVDRQTDEVWSRSKSRIVQKPQRESRVAAVEVDWYCLREDLHPDPSLLLLAAAARNLPEALPRRFGEYEPLQGRYADSGGDGFAAAWAGATSLLFFSGAGPCVGGHLSAGPGARFADRFWSMSLTFLADALNDPGWRDAFRRIFASLADSLPAFYATAQMTRDHIWSGRSLRADGKTEQSISPVRYREGWMGLPPVPAWWTWFGWPFRDFVAALPDRRLTATTSGVLYEAATGPTGPDEIEPLSCWLPADLFAALAPNPRGAHPAPLIRAVRTPSGLGPAEP